MTDTLLGVPSTLTLGRSNSFFMEILGPLSSSERFPKSSLSLLSAYGCATQHCRSRGRQALADEPSIVNHVRY